MPAETNKSVIMVGPLSGPISGQMAAFRESVAAIPDAVVVDAAFVSPVRVLRYWGSLALAFGRTRGPVYITTSRSQKGFWLRDLPVFAAAAALRRPVINHLHGNDFLDFRRRTRRLTKALIDHFYSRITIAIVPSRSLAGQYAAYSSTSVVVVPNFFDSAVLQSSTVKCDSGPINILYFSNFITSKGYTVVCDAVRLIRKRGVPVNLTLCGAVLSDPDMSAAETTQYLQRVENEGVGMVRPAVFGPEKVEVLTRAHVMVLPTRYPTEAAPISLIEGLAAGCYVISSDQGSIADLLKGFEASIVDATSEEVADAICAYASRSDRAVIPAYNRNRAIQLYSPVSYQNRIREVLNEFVDTAERRSTQL